MTITIWNNDPDTRDTVFAKAKAAALRHASQPYALHYGHCGDERCATHSSHLVNEILYRAWRSTPPARHVPLTPQTYRKLIDNVNRDSTWLLEAIVEDELDEHRRAAADRLDAIRLDRDIAVIGTADLRDGSRSIGTRLRFDTVGDILRAEPWSELNVDACAWTIDDNDDLRYTGLTPNGVNTCVYRQIKPRKHLPDNAGTGLTYTLTDPLGPLVRRLYGIPDPKKTPENQGAEVAK